MSFQMSLCERGCVGLVGVLALSATIAVSTATAQPLNLPPAPAGVQVTTSYGIEFSTIGAPGNPAWTSAIAPNPFPGANFSLGSVNYEYRLARTEMRGADWAPFAQAYVQTFGYPQTLSDYAAVTGGVMTDDPSTGEFRLFPGTANRAVQSSWRMFAIYCNWLHNDRGQGSVTGPAVFTSGAYDTSTFTTSVRPNPNAPGALLRTYNDQQTRSPGARFWIPSRSEWLRAAYYNPNPAPGTSISGWMRHPWNSDTYPGGGTTPIYGPPGTPNAAGPAGPYSPDVASYPNIQSPWGLLDLSGSVQEFLEDTVPSTDPLLPNGLAYRIAIGRETPYDPTITLRSARDDLYDLGFSGQTRWPDDMIDFPGLPIPGLRIAAAIPAPPFATLSVGVMLLCTRRRRTGEPQSVASSARAG